MEGITTYTPGQQAHLDAINRHLRGLEVKLRKDMLVIWHHLMKSIEDGMDVYRTFVIDGRIIIEPDWEDVPNNVRERLEKKSGYSIAIYSDLWPEKEIEEDAEAESRFDWRYFENPEQYPADYFPVCRTFKYVIEEGLMHNIFTIDDLMYLKVDEIFDHIVIEI